MAALERVSAIAPPLWPPLLAFRGPGAQSEPHAHHAMHIILCMDGELRVREGKGAWQRAPGVVTAPDVAHAIDAAGAEILLVFLEPESDAGAALRATLTGSFRLLDQRERDQLADEADPMAIMREEGVAWTRRAAAALGAEPMLRAAIHPRVRALIRHLRDQPPGGDTSLAALAAAVGLSTGRLMHVFTESIGVPLRPYLQWLKLQRAAAAITAGVPLSNAAVAAGFADSAHMSRTFRRTFGVTPSTLRPLAPGSGSTARRPRAGARS